MKWYERQKKLFAEQEDQSAEGDKEMELEQSDNVIDSVFMEAINEYTLEEEAIVSYEESTEPAINGSIYEEPKKKQVSNTIISATTNMQGDLEVDGDLYISGNIVGNISCSGDIHLDDGSIKGDVVATNAYIHDATITGNITITSAIEILSNAQIFGNVSGASLTCDANIKGDVNIKGDLLLMQNTTIEGNISAYFLKAEKGASIKGQCCITKE